MNHYLFWHPERRSCRGHGRAWKALVEFSRNFIQLEKKAINYFGDDPQ
jgi:hypothetical protein